MPDGSERPDKGYKDDTVPRRSGERIIPTLIKIGDALGMTPGEMLEIRGELEVIIGEEVSRAEARLLGELEARTPTRAAKWREALIAALVADVLLVVVSTWLVLLRPLLT